MTIEMVTCYTVPCMCIHFNQAHEKYPVTHLFESRVWYNLALSGYSENSSVYHLFFVQAPVCGVQIVFQLRQ